MSASTAMILPGNAQSIGRRAEQQDAFAFSDLSDEDFCRHGGAVCVMCDGMGGHAAGGEAARAAVGAFMASYRRSGAGLGIAERLTQALHEANQAVLQVARRSGPGDSGATLVAAVLHPDGLRWISVGDSRLMLLRGGRLHRINQEHRYRGDLLRRSADDGLDWEDAQADPMGEHLTSSLGEEPLSGVDRSLRPLPLQPGDQVYLATDGLYRVVDDSALLEAAWPAGAARPGPPEAVCAAWLALVQAADRPDQDNVSIAGLAWPGEEALAGGAGAEPRPWQDGDGPRPADGAAAGGGPGGARSWGPSVPPEDWSALPPTVPLTVPAPPLPPAVAPEAPPAARRGGRLPSAIALAVAATVGALATWGALSPSPSAAPGGSPAPHDAAPGAPAASAAAANAPGPAGSAAAAAGPADARASTPAGPAGPPSAAAAPATAAVPLATSPTAASGASASAMPGSTPTPASTSTTPTPTPASGPGLNPSPTPGATPAAPAPDAPPPTPARAERRPTGATAPGLAAPPIPGRPGETERPALGAPPGSTRGSAAPEADGLAPPPRGLSGSLQSGGPLPPAAPAGPAAAPRPATP